ncbi:hypothetical protein ACCO44_08140 [Microbacterium maritypicum]|uniref:hypothetical protein n=1 Tax=Microbacterium maritypicum TaxID=33918 RepID=UPI0035562624
MPSKSAGGLFARGRRGVGAARFALFAGDATPPIDGAAGLTLESAGAPLPSERGELSLFVVGERVSLDELAEPCIVACLVACLARAFGRGSTVGEEGRGLT